MIKSIFHKSWFLDAVESNWSETTVIVNSKVVARMPWVFKKKIWLQVFNTTFISRYCGPSFCKDYIGSNYSKSLSRQKELTDLLLTKLPKFDYFDQFFHTNISNILPWQWNNFQESLKYTYIIENIEDLDTVFKNFQSNVRRNIKKATNLNLHVEHKPEKINIDIVYDFYELAF